MNRFRSILLMFLGVVLGVIPLFAANIFMRDFVYKQGEQHLEQSAQRTLKHSEGLIQLAVDVFSALPHYQVLECGDELQSRFRAMVLRHTTLHDVGLVYNGEFMYCSSLKESTRFYPTSDVVIGSVPHLSYVAVNDGETGKNGVLVKWAISDAVSLGGFILVDAFNLEFMQNEFADLFRMTVSLTNSAQIAETSPESRLLKRAPFSLVKLDPAWTENLITYEQESDRYPITVSVGVPFQAVWDAFSGAMNVINGLGILIGALILIFFMRISLRKPGQYDSIEQGIKRKEFIPYYQPIIDIQNGRLAGCEVLVRWRKADGSIVSPGHFIDIAEASGLARPMTSLLMEKVAQDLSVSYSRHPHLKVAINLFNRHFDDLGIVSEIEQTFGNSGVRFNQLVFEITERQPLENLDRARAIIARMQKLGVRVALDDAGTGHGGFAYLQKLGMNIIKIDKLFVDAITSGCDSVPIVDSLRQMAKGMDMVVVAEGVETEEQLDYLRRTGIDEAQGYIFAPPLPARAYLELVSALGGDANQLDDQETPLIISPDSLVTMPKTQTA
ncbi:EAL domain-containing protein [Cohaesibacter celericrescens]|uniref:EAL domain-containing protein n=1 Tax=Cohaesibacter celericrescens TaxID=2067669 RepID=UPI0035661D57